MAGGNHIRSVLRSRCDALDERSGASAVLVGQLRDRWQALGRRNPSFDGLTVFKIMQNTLAGLNARFKEIDSDRKMFVEDLSQETAETISKAAKQFEERVSLMEADYDECDQLLDQLRFQRRADFDAAIPSKFLQYFGNVEKQIEALKENHAVGEKQASMIYDSLAVIFKRCIDDAGEKSPDLRRLEANLKKTVKSFLARQGIEITAVAGDGASRETCQA